MSPAATRILNAVTGFFVLLLLLHPALISAGEAPRPYDGPWEALQKMPVPAWFDDGKIGIFIHWGPYSAIGYRKGGRGYAEHVPKMIYRDAKHYYSYLKKRWGGHPPEFGYKDIIPELTAANWNPAAWARLFKEVGARYVVMTAEHHDGWANWDSDLTPWNAVDKGPKRDLVGDLGKALRKEGLKYGTSYHRERHTGFFAAEQYVVHSQPIPDIAEEIRRVPEAAMLYGPEFSYSQAFVDDYVARWKEIQDKYHPDMMWLDDFPIYTRDGNHVRRGRAKPEIRYLDDQLRGMITDFMNQAAARGQAVYVNNKGRTPNWPEGVGCLEEDNLKLQVIGPKWQSCTTLGTSYGYLQGDSYKNIEDIIHEMIEVIIRNGNFLVNIGPMADGTIPAPQVERLRAMGAWLAVNGDAIYGTRYWKVCEQPNERLAFTTKGKTLYAIKLTRPTTPFTIDATAGWSADVVRSVKLLGSEADIQWEITSAGLRIVPPTDLGASQYAWSFEVVTDDEQHVPAVAEGGTRWRIDTTEKSALRPRFSWDTVPQWLIVRKATAFTEEESRLLAAAPLVVFEKANGHRDAGSVEDGTLHAARAVKAVDPTTVTLFYWNAVINYPEYRANDTFDKNREAWALKKNGEVFRFKDRYAIYNHLDRGLQDWWIATAKEMASDPAIDGVMIDAICKTDAAEGGGRSIYPGAEYGRAYMANATRLKNELGDKLLVGNALRASKPQCNMHHLAYLDGSYVEGWFAPVGGRTFADYVADGMRAMSQALADGKIILFNSGPGVLGRGAHPADDADYASREAWMKQNIQFPLAVFLMVAEPGAFFHWGTGPDVFPGPRMDVWRNDIYDELRRPLGKPTGPASVDGYTYTRQFEHLDVRLDLESREATFDWH